MSVDDIARTRIQALDERLTKVENTIESIRDNQVKQMQRQNYLLTLMVIGILTTFLNVILVIFK